MERKPLIIGLEKYRLTKPEIFILKSHKPWGIILFKRNIKSFDQVKKLTKEIRQYMKDPYYPILIDEEGGKVSRLSELINNSDFSQSFFGNLFEKNYKNGKIIYKFYLNSICSVLKDLGININTIPVMDQLQNFTNEVIGNRSYSKNIKTIKSLGKICVKILKDNKIGSVIKHIPGHGCSKVDSHKKLPIVKDSIKKLYSNDFLAFENINPHFAMTAHIIYKKIDPDLVGTLSNKVIQTIIRKKIKFKGILISDDISMKALNQNLVYNAKKALKSGCNLVLHCNGKINESSLILRNLNKIDSFTEKKTRQFYEFLR